MAQVEERVEALSRRFMELSDRVRAAASGSSGASLTEVLQEFAAAVLELEVSAEEIRAQDESLAHAQAATRRRGDPLPRAVRPGTRRVPRHRHQRRDRRVESCCQ